MEGDVQMEGENLEATPIKEISVETASTCKMEGDDPMEAAKLEATPIKEMSLEAASTCKMEDDVSMEAAKLQATPIKEISLHTRSPFMVRAWVLRKVQSTEDKRTTLYLEDETGKIRAVGFGEEVAARCKTVEELAVYEVSGVHVFVDKESMHFPAVSEFSLKLNEEMTIKPLMNVPRRYNFVSIASLPNERDLFGVKLDTCEWTCLEVVDTELPEAGEDEELLKWYQRPEAAKARELLEWYQRRDHDSAPPTEISQSGEPLLP